MAFNTKKLVVTKFNMDQHPVFLRVEDVPGYSNLAADGAVQIINFLHHNLENRDLCLQAVEYRNPSALVYDPGGILVAGHGWKVKTVLGQGKDGITVLAHRFSDEKKELKTVKLLSKYAQVYLNHTELFNAIFTKLKHKNSSFFKLHIDKSYTYYNNSVPLNPIDTKNFKKILSELCRLNSWCIKNTGFVLWDFGFGSGRNYMMGSDSSLKWIDYGGAGMLRCPNFQYIYDQHDELPAVELHEPYNNKQSLIFADSNFVMCQFLLHIEYWNDPSNTNADIWSSMLQIKPSVISDVVKVLPSLISTELAKLLYNEFNTQDWTDEITWKKVGKFIDANS